MVNDFRTNDKLAPFRGVRDQLSHTAYAGFVDEIHNELQFVKTFEVSELRRISSIHKCFKSSANERGRSTTEDGLFAKQIRLRLLAKRCLDDAGARATERLCAGQRCFLRARGWILMHRYQRRHTACGEEFASHHRAETLRRDALPGYSPMTGAKPLSFRFKACARPCAPNPITAQVFPFSHATSASLSP